MWNRDFSTIQSYTLCGIPTAVSLNYGYFCFCSEDRELSSIPLQSLDQKVTTFLPCSPYSIATTNKYLLAGCKDGVVRVFRLGDLLPIYQFKAHSAHVTAMYYDGRHK